MIEHKIRLPHFKELDGIRGLAAVAVFAHHFMQFSTSTHPSPIVAVAAYGSLGVQVFFVLSGFLITSLLFVDRDDPFLLHNFYWKRVLRIWPVLIVHVLGCVFLLRIPGAYRYALVALLFVANFGGRLGGGLGVAWTLSIEEQFYLAWPHLIRRSKVETVFLVACVLVVLSAGLRILVPLLHHDAISLPYTIYQLDGLALGAILSCQWFAPSVLTGWRRAVRLFLNGAWGLGAGLLLLIVMYAIKPSNLKDGLAMLAATFFTYRLLVTIVLRPSGQAPVLSWLRTRPLRFLGDVSYALYMYHGFVLVYLVKHLGVVNMDHPWKVFVRFAYSLALSLAISYASLRFIELPIRSLRRYTVRRDASGGRAAPIQT